MNNRFILQLLYKSGFFKLCKNLLYKKGKFVLMFHGVSRNKSFHIPKDIQPHLDILQFENIVYWLSNQFMFLEPNDLMNSEKSGVLLTFDDGFNNNVSNVLPVLEKYNAPALLFVATQHCINPNNWLNFINDKLKHYEIDKASLKAKVKSDYYDGIPERKIKSLSKHNLITFGSHTVTHPVLSKCSQEKLYFELSESKLYLEKATEKSIEYFAYPFGDYNRRILKLVKDLGYKACFGIDKTKRLKRLKYEIPRIGIYDDGEDYLSAKLSGLYSTPLKTI